MLTEALRLIGKLVAKLSPDQQMSWSRYASQGQGVTTPGASWVKFNAWLQEERKAAQLRRQYFLVSGGALQDQPSSGAKPFCTRCKTMGHKVQDCHVKSSLSEFHHVAPEVDNHDQPIFATQGDQNSKFAEAEARVGKCPICSESHTYPKLLRKGSPDTIPWPSSHLESCPKFQAMTPQQKGNKVEELKACPKCTDWKHTKRQCWKQGLICRKKDGENRCRKQHH